MLRKAAWPVAVSLILFAWFSRPLGLIPADAVFAQADPVHGEYLFHAGICSACHNANGGGGLELSSPFGVFRVPNISPDTETGIGGWTTAQFVNALLHGVSPSGKHYYPSFPYTSYARMSVEDAVDLKAYLDGLPPVNHKVGGHELGFPWNIRRGVGLWKRLFLDPSPHLPLTADADPLLLRGRYLAEGPGHCTECHTSRNFIGGLESARWLAGAPSLEGEGTVPNITPSPDGLADWSLNDIAYYLETGFTPDFDTVGGSMVKVQENLSHLTASDREAIARYLKALPPLPGSNH